MKVLLDAKVEIDLEDVVAERLVAWLQANTDFSLSLAEIEAIEE